MPSNLTPDDRFWAKVSKTSDDACWLWTAAKIGDGYGTFRVGRKTVLAHRHAYTLMRGVIPEGMVIDHLCRVRHCVNPSHLEIVTPYENTNRRLNFCKRGHELSLDNVYLAVGVDGKPRRQCRECTRVASKRWREDHIEHCRERDRLSYQRRMNRS